jgi:sugar (pentulose or hexulose) kinase
MTILSVDVGTTGMKMGIFHAEEGNLTLIKGFSETYEIHTYNDGAFSDIDPKKWQKAFMTGCRVMGDLKDEIEVIALSGTTPGMTAMDRDGNAVYPAILMLDQRSRQQANHIISAIGIKTLMDVTGNVPVAGGCSLASILWIKDTHPEIFEKTHVFGHSNTFMARWLTGEFAIDPSSASLTALYNTVENNFEWNKEIAGLFELSMDRLPRVIPSHESAGRLLDGLVSELGMKKKPHVVIGGNDAVLAAYSLGIQAPGEIINVNGTCEITLICLPKCLASRNYNVRAHVIPDRWLTLYVMNAGGIAMEWFRGLFCMEMDADRFYSDFLPNAIDQWLERESGVSYMPYLMGSRYSQKPLKAAFQGLTPETTREELLAALIKGLCQYQREHLRDVGIQVPLKRAIHITGGAVNPAIILAKKKWMRNCKYIHREESSMRGAALLGIKYLKGNG